MKRYVVDRERLEAMYSPMDERFERNMRAMIDTLPARREQRRAAIKPRYALALALLLVVLLCATALAAYVVHSGFLSDVAELNQVAGAYDDWTLAEKESIVRSMKEYGVITDTAQWDAALALSSDRKREKALDELFSERYGINGRTDVITAAGIVEREIGLYDPEWTLEKKAAYTQLMLELDLLGYDTNIDFLPDESDIPQEQAMEIAKKAVQQAYGYDDAMMDSYDVWVSFLLHRSELGVKEPYYMLEFVGAELDYHVVCVSAEGKVLSSEDGYKGVTSPQEDAARIEAEKQVREIPKEERYAHHVAALPLLDTKTCVRKGRIADGALGLADKTAVVYGRICYDAENGSCDGAFAECVDDQGNTVWNLELAAQNGEVYNPETMMQLEGGDLLMILKRQKDGEQRQSIAYILYDQIRIGADGSVLDRRELKGISELTGMGQVRFEQMFAQAGHGGALVSGYMGGRHIPVYAQLDEHGEPMFTWQFEELLGYAPYLKVTEEGYVLTAWNEAANESILRFYDKQGQLLREGEGVKDIRINRVRSCGNGELLVTSGFMEDGEWVLARIDDHGRLLEKMVYEDESGPIQMPTQIVRAGERYVYVSSHHLGVNDWTGHTGVIISDAEGTIREYGMQGELDQEQGIGYLHLAPIGKDCAVLVCSVMGEQEKDRNVLLKIMHMPE